MIAILQGKLEWISPTQLLIYTAGGVGYEVVVSMQTHELLLKQGTQDVLLHTYLQLRENPSTICLYGFYQKDERDIFLRLIRINDIGPSLALRMLSSVQPRELVGYIQGEDVAALKRIKGVGSKIAERLVLELKDKLSGFDSAQNQATTPAIDEACEALIQLGVKEGQARKQVTAALVGLTSEQKAQIGAEELIKLALSQS